MCRVSSSDLVLDYWECKSGWTTKTDCVAKTVAKRDAGINIAVALDNDVVIPVLLSQSTTSESSDPCTCKGQPVAHALGTDDR